MKLTPRERMLIAMTNGKADRAPVAPDISNMIPCRLTGKPFWEIYYFADPPLWRAYIRAVEYFGFDGWFTDGSMQYQWPGERASAVEDIQKNDRRWVIRTRARLDDQVYSYETAYGAADPPWPVTKPIHDIEAQWPLLEKMFSPPVGYNPALLHRQRAELGDLGASGTLTLSSPKIARELAFPTLQKLTRMAKEAGVPTMLHSCGKERALVQWCAEESDLDCINPLEVPPMGDCDLAEIKRLYGSRLALMGNLHTTDVMLLGSPADVEKAAKDAIDAAGAGGGFILSTGDQCGRDTPDANIFKLIEVAKTYGSYS